MKFYRNKWKDGHWKMLLIELTDEEFIELNRKEKFTEVRPGHFVNENETMVLTKKS